MPYIPDAAYDLLLNDIQDNAEELHICSTEPTTYAEATSTYSLGQKTSLSIGEPADASPNGRKITVAAISDGTVDANGSAGYWAIVKASATSRLLSTGELAAPQTVTIGNPFTLPAFDITVPDAVNEA